MKEESRDAKTGVEADVLTPESKEPPTSQDAWVRAWTYWGMIMEMALSVVVGIVIGSWLDRRFGTSPKLLVVFLVFGCVAGLFVLIRIARKLERESQD